jgi:hypothetical protein
MGTEPQVPLQLGAFLLSPAAGNDALQSRDLTLRWTASPGRRFTVEGSEDLMEWLPVPALVAETEPGIYHGPDPV